MYQASRLPFWERVFLIASDSVIFWLWHHLLIVALGLLTLLGLVIYLVVSGIRQKNVAKAVWPVVIFCSCLVYFAMSCAIMD
ncbi:hypothetical protein ME790_04510 [Lactobacillus delbrueckii]|uniref:hypothetical protein n=1 Tax=Lactobacillus delbrueckii TaxID=1584 RepID=UPI001F1C19FB|nr:hypothetical protein [Lactobacillus delbrueckii]GHN31380.1 hypothetical protein ME790_04510 [Lactobacillus delbrueckii]